MKQIKFLGFLIISVMTIMSCGSDDSGDNGLDPNNPNNPGNGISRIDFTIQGASKNGSYSIVDNYETQEIYSNGTVYNSENGSMVNFGFDDELQEIAVSFMVQGTTGTQSFTSVSLEEDVFFSFQLQFNNQTNFSTENHFLTKQITVNITEYETEPTFTPTISELKKIKGTFSGTIVPFDEVVSQEFQNEHTIEGSFEYNLPEY